MSTSDSSSDTSSSGLHKLTEKAQEAEQRAADAMHQAKANLEQTVNRTRESMQAASERRQESVKTSENKASSWWAEQQAAFHAHNAKMRQDMDERQKQHEAKSAEKEAERADADAQAAIGFALTAIEAAELAVLYSILAHKKALEASAAAGVAPAAPTR